MDIEKIKKKIQEIDWSQYKGPKYYEPESVPPAILSLLNLKNSSDANLVGDRILFSIGNNHAGTYYPAVLSALDIIIDIEKKAEDLVRKKCAWAILNDLSCFDPDPDLGSFKGCSLEELLEFTDNKLKPYID
jgi:hypothetical protein